MRHTPPAKYEGFPCSFVGTGCAYELITGNAFTQPIPQNLKEDGWSTLENTNKYVRQVLPIKKKVYFKRGERILLSDFLRNNSSKCLVCVYGHFIYVDGADYWSFFPNEGDSVVCIWYIDENKISR